MKLMSIRFTERLCVFLNHATASRKSAAGLLWSQSYREGRLSSASALNLGWLASQPKRAAHRLEHRKSIVLT